MSTNFHSIISTKDLISKRFLFKIIPHSETLQNASLKFCDMMNLIDPTLCFYFIYMYNLWRGVFKERLQTF